ncbi:MAG: hypothetical protein ABIU54_08470 [Candidatus Eisenbacteria bacterium]
MLRPLVWLRWTLAWRATNARTRIATIVLTLLLFAAFAPVYVGGAVAAYHGVHRFGAPVVVLAFGLCQLVWIWMGLLSGAMGRMFDLDQLLRYPVRTRTVYLVNLFATLTEPLALMTLPTMVAVVIAMGERAGALGALAAAGGALLLMLSTSALMQLLLALLDDLLRREWMRFVAAAITSFTFLGVQWGMRDIGDRVALPFARQEISIEKAVQVGAEALERIPTIGAPAALATAPITHAGANAGWLALATLSGIALSVVVGSRLLERAALHRGGGGSARARRVSKPARGAFAGIWAGMPGGTGTLLAREMVYILRTPQILYQLLIPPLMVLFFYAARHQTLKDQPGFALAMLTTSLMGRNLMLFGHDGPGIRTMFLLPIAARSIVLAKDLGYLITVFAQTMVILAVVAVVGTRFEPILTTTATFGAIAVVMVALVAGNHYSIANPSKPASRGFARRGGGNLASLVGVFVVVLAGASVVAMLWLVRRLAGPQAEGAAGITGAALLAAASVALWWTSLERSATAFLARRENLIEVLAKADAT